MPGYKELRKSKGFSINTYQLKEDDITNFSDFIYYQWDHARNFDPLNNDYHLKETARQYFSKRGLEKGKTVDDVVSDWLNSDDCNDMKAETTELFLEIEANKLEEHHTPYAEFRSTKSFHPQTFFSHFKDPETLYQSGFVKSAEDYLLFLADQNNYDPDTADYHMDINAKADPDHHVYFTPNNEDAFRQQVRKYKEAFTVKKNTEDSVFDDDPDDLFESKKGIKYLTDTVRKVLDEKSRKLAETNHYLGLRQSNKNDLQRKAQEKKTSAFLTNLSAYLYPVENKNDRMQFVKSQGALGEKEYSEFFKQIHEMQKKRTKNLAVSAASKKYYQQMKFLSSNDSNSLQVVREEDEKYNAEEAAMDPGMFKDYLQEINRLHDIMNANSNRSPAMKKTSNYLKSAMMLLGQYAAGGIAPKLGTVQDCVSKALEAAEQYLEDKKKLGKLSDTQAKRLQCITQLHTLNRMLNAPKVESPYSGKNLTTLLASREVAAELAKDVKNKNNFRQLCSPDEIAGKISEKLKTPAYKNLHVDANKAKELLFRSDAKDFLKAAGSVIVAPAANVLG